MLSVSRPGLTVMMMHDVQCSRYSQAPFKWSCSGQRTHRAEFFRSFIISSLCFFQCSVWKSEAAHRTSGPSDFSCCKMTNPNCLFFLGHLWPSASVAHKQLQGSLSTLLRECSLQQKVLPLRAVRLVEGVHMQHTAAGCMRKRKTDMGCKKSVNTRRHNK